MCTSPTAASAPGTSLRSEIIARAGLDTVVRETTSDKFVRPAERPKYSVLSPESLEKRGIAMPGWQDALQRYLAERASTLSRTT